MSLLNTTIDFFITSSWKRKCVSFPPSPLDALQEKIGYCFQNRAMLVQALTHKSAVAQEDRLGLQSNERLEFLGDAVLNCIVTDHLYTRHPDQSEGQLSKKKSLLVSRKILGQIALGLDLGKYIHLGHSEKKSGGTRRSSILSNTFEALLGAVYLDSSIETVRMILVKLLFPRISDFLEDKDNSNYKSTILELSQRDGFGIPDYIVIETNGPEHAKTFTVEIRVNDKPLGRGKGTSKKLAEQQAAHHALKIYDKQFILSNMKGEKNDELVSH